MEDVGQSSTVSRLVTCICLFAQDTCLSDFCRRRSDPAVGAAHHSSFVLAFKSTARASQTTSILPSQLDSARLDVSNRAYNLFITILHHHVAFSSFAMPQTRSSWELLPSFKLFHHSKTLSFGLRSQAACSCK